MLNSCRKRIRDKLAFLLAAALLLPLCACSPAVPSGETETPPQETAGTAPEETAPAAEAPPQSGGAPATLAAAVYPEMPSYSEQYGEDYETWWDALRERRAAYSGSAEGMESYLRAVLPGFLTDTEGENRIFSPLNVYMALSMLTELTDGESRGQILRLLGADSLETVRSRAERLWNANYRDDGLVTSLLANSLWLSDRYSFLPESMEALARHYYASSYRGTMGSPEFDRALQDWINAQTGGLLEDQAAELEMDPRTVMALASALYFKSPWISPFSENSTAPDVFHCAGEDLTVDFMRKRMTGEYYWGERFSAVYHSLESDGVMWFLLPDEGVSPEELLSDAEAMELLLSGDPYSYENRKYLIVNLSVPKFDVVSDMDLIPGLQALGITDVFDYTVSDFTPMTLDEDQIYVSEAKHAARVTIDEEGCTAAAYTIMDMRAGSAMPPEEVVDFTLDRPFLFCVTGAENLPLFVGVVNRPVTE